MAEAKTDWVKKSPKEIEKTIVELAKKGLTAEKIGLKLRDEHGIPKVKLYGIKIKKILEREDLWEDPEHKSLSSKKDRLEKHIEKNTHDYKAKRTLVKNTSRLNRFTR